MSCPSNLIYKLGQYADETLRLSVSIDEKINLLLSNQPTSGIAPMDAPETATEEQVTAFLISKLGSALHRSLITPEQYGPLREHIFGSDEGEEVDADYFEVEE